MQNKTITIAILIATLLTSCSAEAASTPVAPTTQVEATLPATIEDASPPNIILVIADDVGIDSSPCYEVGAEKPNMPNLEALCKSGVVFDNVWATPACSSTRAAILTGQYGLRTGVLAAGERLEDTESIFDVLSKDAPVSYANSVIGKWHVGGKQPDPNHPATFGVDHYAGFLSSGLKDYYEWEITEDGVRSQVNGYATTVFTDKALDWVEAQDSPWFLWLAYNAPHVPIHLPPDGMYTQQGLTGTPRNMRQNTRSYYFAALEALDFEMGRLLNSLSPEVRANTVVIFIGDNGSHDTVSQGFDPEKTKFTVYEGGIHVPMIIAGDGVTQMGTREDALINITDLFATIAELAGAAEVSQPDSMSFMDALTSPNFAGREYAYSEFRFDDGSTVWTVRDQQFKLIEYSDGRRELYDLSTDLFESNDLLAGGMSEEMAAVVSELENYRNGLQP